MAQRPRVSCFIATSLDGFVAGPLGEIDWLFSDGDYGYAAFYASVDAVLMGRATYETSLTFGDWPYHGKRTIVLTNRPVQALSDVEYRAGEVSHIIEQLSNDGTQHVWLIGGGDVVGQCRRAGVVDEWIISIHPVLLGDGLPLFPHGLPRQNLELVRSESFASGLVQLHFRSVVSMDSVA